ncbi:TPA: hypothetical protein DCY65_01885 [Candidatus Acetothermia bacterium]|nr:hypothetical protein [Candidatus Acetothermia bacterium]
MAYAKEKSRPNKIRTEREPDYAQSLLQEIGRIAKIGGWEFDPATGTGTWTEETARIYDLDPADPTNVQNGLSFFHGEQRTRIEQANAELLESGKPYDLELEIITATGNRKWVRTIGRATIVGGRVVRVQGTIQDISERKQREEAARHGEERFRRAVADAPLPMLIHAEDGEILAVNRMWTEITGYTLRDIPTIADWTERAHGQRKEEVRADIDRLYELDGPLDKGECGITTRTGEQRTWAFRSSPVGRMPDGRRLVLSMAADVTDRKRSEEERDLLLADVTAAHRRLASVLERISDGVVALDRDWNYTYVNPQAAVMLNRERPDDLIGKHIWTEYPEGVGQPFHLTYERAMREQRTIVLEDYYAPWDRWFENRIHPSPDGLTIYFTEITTRKQAEAERDRLFNHSLDLMCVAGFDGFFQQLNPAWERSLGWTAAELKGRPGLEFVHPDDRAATARAAERLRRGEEVRGFENRYRHKGGSYLWLSWDAFPLPSEELIFAVVRDVTERRRAAEAVRASEARLAFALEQSQTGGWDLDLVDHTAHRTLKHDQIFGYDALLPEWNYDMFLEHVLPEDRAEVDRLFREATAAETNWSFECRIRRRDGEVRWIWVTGGHQRDADGQAQRLAGIVQDITERKLAEAELQRYADELEQRVAERTAELATARDRAVAADRTKSVFLATVSHELRTPLNSIIGFAGILLQGLAGPVSDEQAKQLGMVQQSARHLLTLINDILDISKIEAGELALHREPFDLRPVIERVVQSVTPLAEKKGLTLVTEIGRGIGETIGDRRRVEQVLLNLLHNAVKFTEAGRITITAVVAAEGDEPQIRVQVTDTGIGINPEDFPRLFVPFQQLDSGLARRHEGTGLGLAISKRLVIALGGTIAAESPGLGQGSTFTVTLPLQPRGERS